MYGSKDVPCVHAGCGCVISCLTHVRCLDAEPFETLAAGPFFDVSWPFCSDRNSNVRCGLIAAMDDSMNVRVLTNRAYLSILVRRVKAVLATGHTLCEERKIARGLWKYSML
jgi:hypothetical protein